MTNPLSDIILTTNYNLEVCPGYEPLAEVFQAALDHAQKTKGRERHANDNPFTTQPICEGARVCGLGAMTYQVRKKTLEAQRLFESRGYDAAIGDIWGAINYLAAMAIVMEEKSNETR